MVLTDRTAVRSGRRDWQDAGGQVSCLADASRAGCLGEILGTTALRLHPLCLEEAVRHNLTYLSLIMMSRSGYDAWILSMREYAEDTAFRSLVSSTTTFSARRRTLYLFHTHPDVPSPLHLIDNMPSMWDTVLDTLEKIDPKRIAVNVRLSTA